MYKYILLTIILILSISYSFKNQKDTHFKIIKEVTDSSAKIVTSKSSTLGEMEYFTSWDNAKCIGTVVIRSDNSYYVTDSQCLGK